MNEAELGITIYRAGYVCTENIFKEKVLTDERIVDYYELVIFLTDGGYFKANDKKYTVKAGSCRLYRKGDKVSSYKFNDVYAIHFNIENQKYTDFLEAIPTFFTLADVNETIKIVEKLVFSLLANDEFDSVCKLCDLLSHIKSNMIQQSKKESTVTAVKEYLDINYSENITLDSLSKHFYLHPVYLQRRFKQEYGLSPTEYVIKVRINRSKNYLISTNMSVEEISYKIGFSYPSYFIRLFKKHEHCTPYQYRKLTVYSN